MSSLSNDAAGAGSSLSEKDKAVAQLTEQLMNKEDEIDQLTKQLQIKTTEMTTLEDKIRVQLEQQYTATIATQREEYEKELQDIRTERKHYKGLEVQNDELKGEIMLLKHDLLNKEDTRQGVADLEQQLREREERIHGLLKASEEKAALLNDSHRALHKTTETLQNTIAHQAMELKVES